jgi:predicted ATPase
VEKWRTLFDSVVAFSQDRTDCVGKLKGELTLAQSSVQQEAEECFWKAIEIACRQSAKSLELRAVMSLSRLWQQQGKQDEARQLLAEVYGWFTEGFDIKDWQEAKVLLEELQGRS